MTSDSGKAPDELRPFPEEFREAEVDPDLTIVISREEPDAVPDTEDENGVTTRIEEFYSKGRKFSGGGQAEIFCGTDLNLQRDVAIKSLRREFVSSPAHRRSFLTEARVTARLEHPGIVPIHAVMTDDRRGLHMAMKIIRGKSLKNRLEDLRNDYSSGGFSPAKERDSIARRLDIFLRICDALEYAHSCNIMHCDLKPENIMTGDYHGAYLMDWGLARLIDDPEFDAAKWQPPKQITGTVRFLSPEALRGEYCDHRADIYAMGLILFEILTLNPAFSGTDSELVDKIRRGEIRDFHHRYGYTISEDLRAIVLKAAAPDREERYPTIAAMAEDIRRYNRGEAVSARPDSLLSKVARWSNRHRRAVLIMALSALLIGTAGVAYGLYKQIFFERESHIRQLALNEAAANNSMAALNVDRQLTKFELSLMSAAREAAFLLNSDTPLMPVRKKFIRPAGASSGNFPAAGEDGTAADTFFWHLAPGAEPQDMARRIERMEILRMRMQRIILESRPNAALDGREISELRRQGGRNTPPIVKVFFGFHDGLFLSYPGDGRYEQEFDHRNRFWYHSRLPRRKSSVARWSRPYLNVFGEDVISLTVPLQDIDRKLYGSAGISVSTETMLRNLNVFGNGGGALISKSLVDINGDLLLDTSRGFLQRARENYQPVKGRPRILRYAHRELLPEFKRRGSGVLTRRESGRKVAYVFTRLAVEEWFYVEKFDLEKLVSSYQERNAESIAEGRRRPAADEETERDEE